MVLQLGGLGEVLTTLLRKKTHVENYSENYRNKLNLLSQLRILLFTVC